MPCDICGIATEFNSKYCDSCASILSISDTVIKYENPDLVYSAKCPTCKADMFGENCTMSPYQCNDCVMSLATLEESKAYVEDGTIAYQQNKAEGVIDEYSRYSELRNIASEEEFVGWWNKYRSTVVSVPVSADRVTECPVCGIMMVLEQVNCAVFRCAQVDGKYINPHSTLPSLLAAKTSKQSKFVGCMMPLVFDQDDNVLFVPLDKYAGNTPHFY